MGHKCEGLHCGGCRRHGSRVAGRGVAVGFVAAVVALAVLAVVVGLVLVLTRARAEARQRVADELADQEWQRELAVDVPAWPERPALPSARPVLPGWVDDGAQDDARPLEWWQRGGRDG